LKVIIIIEQHIVVGVDIIHVTDVQDVQTVDIVLPVKVMENVFPEITSDLILEMIALPGNTDTRTTCTTHILIHIQEANIIQLDHILDMFHPSLLDGVLSEQRHATLPGTISEGIRLNKYLSCKQATLE